MKLKEWVKSAVFLFIFVLILISLTYILRVNGEVKDIFTGFYAEQENTIDVIMIGSSPVYPFYAAPQMWGEYGITSYPLSSHVQRPSAALPLLKEAYKTQSPKVVVFEMRMYTMEDGDMATNMAYARGVTDNLKYSWNRIEAINRLVGDKQERYTYYFDIFKYHSNWKTMIYLDQLACYRYEKSNPLKGFVIKDTVVPLELERIPQCSHITETAPIPAEQEERLVELLGYLQERGQKAIFIVSPYRIEAEEQMMYNYMTAVIEEYGYRFINFNNYYDEIGIDFTTDYYDGVGHVNALGASKCTAFLGEILEQEFMLEDKRQGQESLFPAYRSWEAAYERYQAEAAAALVKIETAVLEEDHAE